MKVRIGNRKWFDYSVIMFFIFLISIPFFSKNINVYNGDGLYEIARSFETYRNFQINDGRILSSFFGYLGTGDNLLSSPLSTYLLMIGNYIFGSYILAYKILAVLFMWMSAYFMYKFMDKVVQNKNISLLASVLYIFTPIHLNEIYVNNSLTNLLVLAFIPVIFLGVYRMINTTETTHYVTIGLTRINFI